MDITRNLILKIRTGSQLYGTDTPDSDEDYVGIFIKPSEYILGLNNIEQIDLGLKSKTEEGKNAPDAIDYTAYTLEKFCTLAMDNNPNILELLFVNPENIIYRNGYGKALLNLRNSFLSMNIKHRFLGYAFSQRHKMIVKLENYDLMTLARDKLVEIVDKIPQGYMKYIYECIDYYLFKDEKTGHYIRVGDINLPRNTNVRKALEILNQRISKFGHRTELISKYGYDTKFASHLIRLLLEGIELLETSNLVFPLQDAKLLKDIKQGEYTLEMILKMADTYEQYIEKLFLKNPLPHKPDFNKINEFVIDTNYVETFFNIK